MTFIVLSVVSLLAIALLLSVVLLSREISAEQQRRSLQPAPARPPVRRQTATFIRAS